MRRRSILKGRPVIASRLITLSSCVCVCVCMGWRSVARVGNTAAAAASAARSVSNACGGAGRRSGRRGRCVEFGFSARSKRKRRRANCIYLEIEHNSLNLLMCSSGSSTCTDTCANSLHTTFQYQQINFVSIAKRAKLTRVVPPSSSISPPQSKQKH